MNDSNLIEDNINTTLTNILLFQSKC